jgi:vitamin B12/bleomycin/antimicrobial peptide transport system ATP-binding/permease protein
MQPIVTALSTFLRLALPYFRSEERWAARGLLAGVVVAEFGVVYALVAFNQWNAYFFNAIQDRNWQAFLFALALFIGIAVWTVVATMAQFFFGQTLIMRWRRWMTERFVGRWMADGRHYRMQFLDADVDNTHLRIANDILIFLQRTHDLGYNLLGSLIALFSFSYILWGLSSIAPLVLFGVDLTFPGYLFFIAIAYAGLGTVVAHFVGRPLIALNFFQQRYESDFRFAIARVWDKDSAEPVALMRGEEIERRVLDRRFSTLVRNWTMLIRRQTWLTAFTTGYGQISLVFPTMVAAPAYFAGAISLGTLIQASLAFQRVDIAFAFFLHSYARIAEWKASMDRVAQLETALDLVDRPRDPAKNIIVAKTAGPDLKVADLVVKLTSGAPVAALARLDLAPGDRALLTGPSGSGKSSVLRALAGIWPVGAGKIEFPAAADVLALPQKVYFPLGTLRAAVAYPTPTEEIDEERLHRVLTLVGLEHLASRLDEAADWGVLLASGEQQRIVLARALLKKPDILLLDEATSNFDDATSRELYGLLMRELPRTTLISIGRPGVLAEVHGQSIALNSFSPARTTAAAV